LNKKISMGEVRDDKLISEEYAEDLFQSLVKMKPEIKEQVEKERSTGMI